MKLALIAALSACAFGQAFEVATIKPSPPLDSSNGPIYFGPKGGPGTDSPGRYWCNYCTLPELIAQAYDLPEFRIVSAGRLPDERYHIVATIPAATTRAQFRAMLGSLLADRFQLAVGREPRTMQMFRLTVASGGPKLTPHDERPEPPPSAAPKERIPGISYRVRDKSVGDFARMLAGQLRAPVEDATGLAGRYDFDIAWSLSDAVDSPLPTVFGAVQSLGLKLEARKGPVDCVVVERFAKPQIDR